MSSIIDALADGFIDGGVDLVYGFPGFKSEAVLEKIDSDFNISVNERVAYGEAYGASVGGKRSLVGFKNIGLNIASDAYSHSVISGVNAGMVVLVTDDIEVWGSQESQDTRELVDCYGGFLYEPESLQSAYDFARRSFYLSEKLDVPIVVRITNQALVAVGEYTRTRKINSIHKDPAPNNPQKYVVHPYYFRQQSLRLERKRRLFQDAANSIYSITTKNHSSNKCAITSFGFCNDTVSNATVCCRLKINTIPNPTDALNKHLKSHSQNYIIESGGPYLYNKASIAYQPKSLVPLSPVSDAAGTIEMKKWFRYEPLFALVSRAKLHYGAKVIADIAQFTVESMDTVDVVLSMGASIPIAIGLYQASNTPIIAILGDCSFNHEGIQVLYEAVRRNVSMHVFIIDNGVSWCTGCQKNASPISSLLFPETINYAKFNYSVDALKNIENRIRDAMTTSSGITLTHVIVPVGSTDR